MSDEAPSESPLDPASAGRVRRRTVKRIDYSKEQAFSDEDIFEDSDVEPAKPTKRSRSSRGATPKPPRPSNTPLTLNDMDDDEESVFDNKPVYTEKGYDPSLPPIRERFPFLPEYEEDGSPRIELIVGRRPVEEKEDELQGNEDVDENDNGEDVEEEEEVPKKRATRKRGSPKKQESPNKDKPVNTGPVEYEYLVKYKGKSYLHLEWKTGADLESMNKSAKGIYRRYLKKLAAGTEEDLESPDFDPAFVTPEKILDEAEQEVVVELTDKELLRWEKQREKELAEDKQDDDDNDDDDEEEKKTNASEADATKIEEEKKDDYSDPSEDWPEEEVDYGSLDLERLRKIINREGEYYPSVPGSDNPYRDGYIKEQPRKPRASYLFFQGCMRSYYQKHNPEASQSELMTMMGNKWQSMTDEEKEPFLQMARDESKQYDKERALMEKAQKPNNVWQPLRRCRMVLERLAKDSFADIFLEPVDPEDFPDYDDIIDTPMDIGTVRTKLESKKYQAPEQFARDMRKIWNNCKIYNQHGSAIWHVADYMSKQFERLYNAWVVEFRERYLRWADPRARPWEHSCRMHDGKCGCPANEIVLCDHCDAMYGFKCLNPPLKKVPTKAWHCAECKPKLKTAKGARMLSAAAENAARKRAEYGDLPKKKIKQTMFLVKWAGLGYEFCTWETREDVNDDELIASFRRLNKGIIDDSELPEDTIANFLSKVRHVNSSSAGGNGPLPVLRAQLYAQTRAVQFSKFGFEIPEKVAKECGPATKTLAHWRVAKECNDENKNKNLPREVITCVNDLVGAVERGESLDPFCHKISLPPPLVGEYDAIVPITSKGLLLNVGEIHGSVAFLGYRQFPNGSKGPAEIKNIIRNVGDKIIAVDGESTIGKTFKEVIAMLRESAKNRYAYMRFLENRFSVCESDIASGGTRGRYAIEELRQRFTSDRQKAMIQRIEQGENDRSDEIAETKDETKKMGEDSEDESDEGSEGEFEPESDDEELVVTGKVKEVDTEEGELGTKNSIDTTNNLPEKVNAENGGSTAGTKVEDSKSAESAVPTPEEKITGRLYREENTRSLAFRLLDMDVGYSSDEGGEEDRAFFIDGVDQSFARLSEVKQQLPESELPSPKKDEKETKTIPARKNEFMSLGLRGRLSSSIALTSIEPDIENFDNFPMPSSKELNLMKQQEEELARKHEEMSPSKNVKRSTVKIEQISSNTGEIIHIWANAEAAAATLQIRLDQLRQVLSGEYDEEIGDEVGGYKWRFAVAGAKVTAGTGSTSRGGGGKKAKEAWLEFRDKLYDPSEPHAYKNGNRLRDYQVDGVNWLASTWYKKQSCILADEMGLGKTVQIVCYLEHLFRVEQIRRPYLVVVPLSTVEHWRREFEGWTDMVCCVYHDRQRVWRDVMREYEWYFKDKPHTPEFLKFDVLVTTYDTLISDFDIVSQIPFRVAVVDEAHRLRNQKGKLLECMREISAKGTIEYGFQSRVLMSGTPLQNSLEELWTLLNFIEPFKFPDIADFKNRFGNMSSQSQVESLQQMISPYMLRRVKEDVAKDIPAKEETVIDVELTSIQKQYYRAIFEHNHAFLAIGATRQSAPKLMNIQMELRKVCNHPFLLDNVEHRETERKYKEFLENGEFEGKSPEERQNMLNNNGYVMTSGKMVLMDKLLPKLRQEGHKVLIFSQMVKMLDLLAEYCDFRDFKYERLDGRIRGAERQKAIDRFETEEDSFIFMLSTRAGGVGINLTAADICVIFDSDWNPQNDVQAQARCHRIGQSKEVKVIRLITSRSFEQEMFERASRKLGLEQAVLGTFEKDKDDGKPTQKEMEQLLKRGAYALLEDDNDEETRQFCADDIDTILAKRSRTRVVEGPKTSSWLNKSGMTVSKSKFSAEAGSNELDMDDPLFWQKVMPDFVTPTLMLKKLNDLIDDIDGKVRGPGRGRGRWKKKAEVEQKEQETKDREEKQSNAEEKPSAVSEEGDSRKEDTTKNNHEEEEGADALISNETLDDLPDDDNDGDDDDDDNEQEDDRKNKSKVQLSRTHMKKVLKFMSDLKSMMQTIIDDDDEELQPDEKSACQKLLLTVSVKEKVFSEEQRRDARLYLKKLEGDRRRRCRTSEQPKFGSAVKDDDAAAVIPEHLRIASRKRKVGKKRKSMNDDADDAEQAPKVRKRGRKSEVVDEDGYLQHSDSEGDWSDVAEDLYSGAKKKKDRISRKEANRRRSWGADDDVVTAAGRPWPVFPRHVVHKVLATVLDEVMAYDEKKGGAFSEPVPQDEFPDYYEKVKQPMDYGTMRTKLENNEYRSAQQMQKDFVLILKNCRQYNAPSSDIVKEARQQHMMRPKVLKEAASKHNLFLAEDGSVLEIFDEDKSPKKKSKKSDVADENSDDERKKNEGKKKSQKGKGRKKKESKTDDNVVDEDAVASTDTEVEVDEDAGKKKPRIRIKLPATSKDISKPKKGTKRKSRSSNADEEEHDPSIDEPVPKKQKKADKGPRKKGAKSEEPTVKDVKTKSKQKESKPKSRSIFLNASHWKKGRMDLNKSFSSAKEFMTSQGPWTFPSELPDDKFKDVALLTLERMGKVDKYSVFAEPVTEDEAPDYFDVVKNPMDFGTMMTKVKSDAYGKGTKAAAKLYKDFLLVFDNCLAYNEEDGEVAEEASRILGYVPEAYVNACLTVLGEENL